MSQDAKTVAADTRTILLYQSRSKSTGVAYLLWLLFGGFGIHRFYIGSNGVGMLLLGCTVAGFFFLFPLFFTGLIMIYDLFAVPSLVRTYNENLLTELGV